MKTLTLMMEWSAIAIAFFATFTLATPIQTVAGLV